MWIDNFSILSSVSKDHHLSTKLKRHTCKCPEISEEALGYMKYKKTFLSEVITKNNEYMPPKIRSNQSHTNSWEEVI